jgi:DNA-directed RNA polymerase specialized sigma24 family protein
MASSFLSDPDLVRGLQRRDREALACVYREYHAAVYNLCARILNDREEAKDVTQDVFSRPSTGHRRKSRTRDSAPGSSASRPTPA